MDAHEFDEQVKPEGKILFLNGGTPSHPCVGYFVRVDPLAVRGDILLASWFAERAGQYRPIFLIRKSHVVKKAPASATVGACSARAIARRRVPAVGPRRCAA